MEQNYYNLYISVGDFNQCFLKNQEPNVVICCLFIQYPQ
jgi:hypothetical protein